jgi:hypothetical protein
VLLDHPGSTDGDRVSVVVRAQGLQFGAFCTMGGNFVVTQQRLKTFTRNRKRRSAFTITLVGLIAGRPEGERST